MTAGRFFFLVLLVVATSVATWGLFRAERDDLATPEGYVEGLAKGLRGDDPVRVAIDATTSDFAVELAMNRRLTKMEAIAWVESQVKLRRFNPGISQAVTLPGLSGTYEVLVTGTFTEGDLMAGVRPPLSAFRAAVSLVPSGRRFQVRAIRFLP